MQPVSHRRPQPGLRQRHVQASGTRPLLCKPCCVVETAAATLTGSAQPVKKPHIKVRQCNLDDVAAVGRVCAQAFGLPNYERAAGNATYAQLQQRYESIVQREVQEKIGEALERKAEAASEHRAYRWNRYLAALRAQLAALRGDERVAYVTAESPSERRTVVRWQRTRQYACLVAEEEGSKEVVGCLLLSMAQPEAFFRPPFPSTAPWKLYISNMSVAPGARRRGVASALLRACLRLARAWGADSVWLNVDQTNYAAQVLYEQHGFVQKPERWGPLNKFRELLMVKTLDRRPDSNRAAAGGSGGTSSSDSGGSNSRRLGGSSGTDNSEGNSSSVEAGDRQGIAAAAASRNAHVSACGSSSSGASSDAVVSSIVSSSSRRDGGRSTAMVGGLEHEHHGDSRSVQVKCDGRISSDSLLPGSSSGASHVHDANTHSVNSRGDVSNSNVCDSSSSDSVGASGQPLDMSGSTRSNDGVFVWTAAPHIPRSPPQEYAEAKDTA